MASTDKQLQYMQDFLINIAQGDFDAKLNISNESDEDLVAMQVGINMLVEELKSTTISRVFMNSIYDGINDILIVLNKKGEIQKTNHLVENLLLFSESELLNQSLEKLIQADDLETVKSYITNVFEKGTVKEAGLNFIKKDKSTIPVSCSFSALYNNLHQPSGVLLVAKNITALLQAKSQLQDKNDELNLFVYKSSHDLKGPVSSIQGLLGLAKKSENINELKMYFNLINESTKKLDTIISDLLVLGKVSYGDLEYTQINTKQTIDTTLKSIEFIEGHKDIAFSVLVDEDAKYVSTDKSLLNNILLNLIENAIKYRQKKQSVSFLNIKVFAYKKGVLFVFEDNGIGIENSLQENIFKMFYRATYTSKGSGLGLYIVKMSVLKLGGEITFTSALDQGTTFELYLPSL
jgi:PAS domain S-box-containing protein